MIEIELDWMKNKVSRYSWRKKQNFYSKLNAKMSILSPT